MLPQPEAREPMPTPAMPLAIGGLVGHAVAGSLADHAVARSPPANIALKPTGRNRGHFGTSWSFCLGAVRKRPFQPIGRRLTASVGRTSINVFPV